MTLSVRERLDVAGLTPAGPLRPLPGVAGLPFDAPVEIEAVVEIRQAS